jgi:hypothetical protein
MFSKTATRSNCIIFLWLARGRVNVLTLLACLRSVLVGFDQTADLEKPKKKNHEFLVFSEEKT